jgi:hypothetical protein
MRTRVVLAILVTWLLVIIGVLVVKPAAVGRDPPTGPVALASPARSPGTDAAPKPRDPGHPSRRDLFGATARSYLIGRVGAVPAAVYDVAPGRT